MKKIQYNDPGQSRTRVEAAQIEFLHKPVRFSLRHCSTKKGHCISSFASDRPLLQTAYDRFGVLENMTWQQARQIDRKKGISIEPKTSPNHKILSKEFPGFDTFGHFRVNSQAKSKFRIFGALKDDCFCILKFDVDGGMNH